MSARERDPRWVRLGDELRSRRASLGYPRRTDWIRTVEGPGFSGRLIVDLETGARTNVAPESISIAETRYELQPGAIRRFLAGEVEALQPLPTAGEPAPPVNAAEDPDDETWDEVRSGPPFLDPGETLRWRQVGDDEFRFCLTRPDEGGTPQHVWHNFDSKWAADSTFVLQYLRYRIDRFAIKTPRADREG